LEYSVPASVINLLMTWLIKCRDSSVGMVTGWAAGFRFPAGARFLSPLQRSDRLWGPLSLLSDNPRGKAITSIFAEVKNGRAVPPPSPVCFHVMVLNQLSTGPALPDRTHVLQGYIGMNRSEVQAK
jgi:hypothetical protein